MDKTSDKYRCSSSTAPIIALGLSGTCPFKLFFYQYTTENIDGVVTERLVDTCSTNEKGQFVFYKLNNQKYRVQISAHEQGYNSTTKEFLDLLNIKKDDCIIILEDAT